MWFKVGAVSNILRITFDIKRHDDTDPKSIQLQYVDGTDVDKLTVLGTSDSFEVGKDYKKIDIIYRPEHSLTNFGFKLTGYKAADDGTRAFYIRDVKVQQLKTP